MIHITLLARVSDGLPLSSAIGDDEETDQQMVKYNNQAKLLFRKLNDQSPKRCSLESGPYTFHYLIENGVCYLCLADKDFSEKSAFAYLSELSNEFSSNYVRKVDSVTRPYHFIEFDSFIQSTKRSYMSRSGRPPHLSAINNELQDVQRIMVQNIEDVIHRGEALTILDDKAANLSILSKKYKDDARYLNLRSTWTKIGAVLFVVLLVLMYFRFFW